MDQQTNDLIKNEIENNEVCLFMKGTPEAPQCGFSMRAVQMLQHLNVPFGSSNVLSDPEIRQGVKDFAEWPTIPQLYIKGQFVGGIIQDDFGAIEFAKFLTKSCTTVEPEQREE